MLPTEHPPLVAGSVAAVIPAAGSGRRFGDEGNKLLAELAGRPIWIHAVTRIASADQIGRIVMPVAAADRAALERQWAAVERQWAEVERQWAEVERPPALELVPGGAQRTDSVRAGLQAVAQDDRIAWVAIHDAARPLLNPTDLAAVFAAAARSGAAILATPVTGTIKRQLDQAGGCQTVDRRGLWIALTPQVFRLDWLLDAYNKDRGRPATDDAQLVERLGRRVELVHGSAENIKITHPEDLTLAESIFVRQRTNQ